jgi:hypothetical protein
MDHRCRILIAKQSSRGLGVILKGLPASQIEVVAFYDRPPDTSELFAKTEVDI